MWKALKVVMTLMGVVLLAAILFPVFATAKIGGGPSPSSLRWNILHEAGSGRYPGSWSDRESDQKQLDFYREFLAKDPSNINVRLRMAELLERMNRDKEALAEYIELASCRTERGLPLGSDPYMHFKLYNLQTRLGDHKAASQSLDRILLVGENRLNDHLPPVPRMAKNPAEREAYAHLILGIADSKKSRIFISDHFRTAATLLPDSSLVQAYVDYCNQRDITPLISHS